MTETITITELAAKASTLDRQGAERDYAYDAARGCALDIGEAIRRAIIRWSSDRPESAPYWAAYALAARAAQETE